MGELKALNAVAVLGLAAHDVQDLVDDLGALGVVALGPVVARAILAEDEVVRPEDVPERARAYGVDGAGLQVHDHRPRYVTLEGRLVEEDVYLVQLDVVRALVRAVRLDAVLARDHLPELERVGRDT